MISDRYRPLFFSAYLLIGFCTAGLVAYSVTQHKIFDSWDSVLQYYSGLSLLSGQGYTGWAADYWPPLQPLLLALGDPLAIGKAIAVISSMLILVASYAIIRELGKSRELALLFCLFLATNRYFIYSSTVVENHALETAFFLLGLLVAIRAIHRDSLPELVLCGLLVAIAGLTRYTAYALALAIGLVLVSTLDWKGLRKSAVFFTAFISLSSLWWVPNFLANGSPLFTRQYMNMGMVIHPSGPSDWLWKYSANFSGLIELVAAYPSNYALNFAANIATSFRLILGYIAGYPGLSIVAVLWLIFLTFSLFKKGTLKPLFGPLLADKRYQLLLLAPAVYILLVSNVFVFSEALYPVKITLYIFLFAAFCQAIEKIPLALMAFCACNLAYSYIYIQKYLGSQRTDDEGQLSSLTFINTELRKDPNISSKVVLSVHPARAYYANSKWLGMPKGTSISLCDILDYNFPEKITATKSQIPVDRYASKMKPDYLILDGWSLKHDRRWLNDGEIYTNGLADLSQDCSGRLELAAEDGITWLFRVDQPLSATNLPFDD